MDISFVLDNLFSFVNGLETAFNLDIASILGAGSSGAPVAPDLPAQ